MYQSKLQIGGHVPFPEFTGEKVYMKKFSKKAGLPQCLRRWQPTVDAMLKDVDAPGDIYLMIDQGNVKAGNPHRRPGVHIDGYWVEQLGSHGGGRHTGHWKTGWNTADLIAPEGIILASNVPGAVAYVGEWNGVIGDGGDCSHINVAGMSKIALNAHTAYAGNVGVLHESIPVVADCARTLVRLNVPGWHPS